MPGRSDRSAARGGEGYACTLACCWRAHASEMRAVPRAPQTPRSGVGLAQPEFAMALYLGSPGGTGSP